MLHGTDNSRTLDQSARGESACVDAIDFKHLRRYTLADEDLEREVLGLFLTQLPQMIAALQHASNEREWRIAAHTLKGSSCAVGAWPISDLAETAESLYFDGDHRTAADVVARIEEAAVKARSFILSHNASPSKRP